MMNIPKHPASHPTAAVTQRSTRRHPLARAALVCAFLAAPLAHATEASALPPVQHSQGIAYVTGGVDLDQSTALKAAMRDYPLVVEVFNSAGGKNEYTAASQLSIRDRAGQPVFSTALQGPFALLKIAPGRYEVRVEYEGQVKQRQLEVTSGSSSRATFVFGGA